MARRSIIDSHHGRRSSPKTGTSEVPVDSVNFSRQEVPTVGPDLIFEGHGSIVLIRAASPTGKTWLNENVGDDNTITFGGAIVCEPRYVRDIFRGAVASGLVCF